MNFPYLRAFLAAGVLIALLAGISSLAAEAATAMPVATSFQALDDNRTVIPPDTMGAVGPDHVMTVLNSQVRFQNRNGGVISTFDMDNYAGKIWPVLVPVKSYDLMDPRVIYDPYGGRWIFTAAANPRSADSAIITAVSQTSDPTGAWHLSIIPADTNGVTWADFPTLGFNSKWVVVAANMFTNNDSFSKVSIFVIDKARLYAGTLDVNLDVRRFTDAEGFTLQPAVTYDPQLDTMYLVESWNGDYEGTGSLRISTVTGTVGNETYTAETAYPVIPSPWAYAPPETITDFAPQFGSAQKIDTGDDRLLNAVYRNGSLWCAHTVFLPADTPTRSAAQWWQVNPTDGTVLQFGRVDDPNGVNFFAYPTIAVNRNNDALLGYSRFSANQYASANYSFRYGSDQPGTMGPDTVYREGDGVYDKIRSTYNRWGDYSATVVDPVDDTDLWTIQEYAGTPAGSESLWGTWWARVEPEGSAAPEVTSSLPVAGAAGVAVTAAISARFNEAMDESSITAAFTVSDKWTAVDGTVSYDPTTLTATFTPAVPFTEGTVYSVTIGTGAKDLAGHNLAAPVTWSFTTADVPPVVTYAIPQAGAIGVAPGATVSALFNEALDPGAVNGATFRLAAGSVPVAGAVSYDTATLMAMFTPSSPLALNTAYTATVTTGVRNQTGTYMDAPFSWSFTTGCFVSMGSACYPSIAAAYAAAADGSVIRTVAELPAMENVSFSRGISVTLAGGYDPGFTGVTGSTVVEGLVVVNGSMVIGNLTIQ